MTEEIKIYDRRTEAEVPATIHQDGFIGVIERLSRMPDIPVDKIKQIFDMQEAALDRTAKQDFNIAMTATQNKIELVVAKEKNIQTGSNYADLKAVLIKAKPIYTEEGFSLMFYEGDSPKESQKRVCVDIMHSGGHTEKRHIDVTIQTTGIAGKVMMTQIHGEGSAFSYGRRYLTCMVFNIPTGDDDDGNAASGPPNYIDEKQQTTLTDLLATTESDVPKFLAFMKVESINQIKKSDYQKAIAPLNKKLSKVPTGKMTDDQVKRIVKIGADFQLSLTETKQVMDFYIANNDYGGDTIRAGQALIFGFSTILDRFLENREKSDDS